MARKKYLTILVLGCFLSLTFVVYFRALTVYFLSDDFGYVLLARDTSVPESLSLIVKEQKLGSGSGLYRPLVDIAFVFAYKIFKFNPAGYHAVSLILHALIAWLFYLIILKISDNKTLAFIAGLFFICYPMNVESVVWLSNWTTLISSFFIMLTLFLYWKYRVKKNIFVFCAFLSAILFSLLAKETAIIAPLLIISIDLARHRISGQGIRRLIRYWKGYAISAALVGSFFVWRFVMLKGRGGYRTPDGESIYGGLTFVQFKQYLSTIKYFLFNYLNEIVFRFQNRQAIIYWSVFVLLIILIIAYLFNKRKSLSKSWLFFGFLWVYISTLPVINLLNGVHRDLSGSRFLYLPSLGFCLMLAVIFLEFNKQLSTKLKYTKGTAVAIFVLVLGFLTYKNQIPWLEASKQVRTIGQKVQTSVIEPPKKSIFYFKDLPDNWAGAYSLRNGIENYLLLLYDKPLKYLTAKKVTEFPEPTSGKNEYYFE